ncbi:MAG: ABC transporter ATP-binding protein [Anaerolineae bacterium]|nr:ABC transporter ATP-binding protein [Phycisphaerae bacterium]
MTLQNVRKDYVAPDRSVLTVLDITEFTLGDGEQVALVGTSGSGKTTFLHVIAGIIAPDEGHIRFNQTDVSGLSEAQRDVFRGQNIGYIFQTHHLLGGLTALENVLLGMSFTGRASDPARAKHLLDAVGLSDRLNYKPGKLSVGQQQRVAVARALANRPKLVLADEPTGALDERNAQQVLQLIRNLCTEVNAALFLVTHDMDIANQFPRVVSLKELNRASA